MVGLFRRTRTAPGFTLLEVLVAMAVFAVLAVIAYEALDSALKVREESDARDARRVEIMRAVTILERDLLQMTGRSVRDEYDQQAPAVLIERPPAARIELTRTGAPNPRREKRSAMQRIAYSIEGDRLVRWRWPVLDRTAQTVPLEEAVLEDVEAVTFEALAANGSWSDSWPVQADPAARSVTDLPRAVRVTVTLGDLGTLDWVVPAPGA